MTPVTYLHRGFPAGIGKHGDNLKETDPYRTYIPRPTPEPSLQTLSYSVQHGFRHRDISSYGRFRGFRRRVVFFHYQYIIIRSTILINSKNLITTIPAYHHLLTSLASPIFPTHPLLETPLIWTQVSLPLHPLPFRCIKMSRADLHGLSPP